MLTPKSVIAKRVPGPQLQPTPVFLKPKCSDIPMARIFSHLFKTDTSLNSETVNEKIFEIGGLAQLEELSAYLQSAVAYLSIKEFLVVLRPDG